MEQYRIFRSILCIDLKSFYASVECALLGLDPFKTPLVVADRSRGNGSIVLAISPYLKQMGMPSRCRIHEIDPNIPIIFRKPQMATYLEYASKIIEIYLKFVSEEDLYVYSIDESFLDVTSYLQYYNMSAQQLSRLILKTILEETKLFATCGIGPNMLIAKLALDLESKKATDFIASWTYDDIPKKLWPVTPLSDMWGIGQQMQKRLNRLGLVSIGDIARYDITTLKRNFGVLGEELYYHTHGIDMSVLQERGKLRCGGKSYGSGQTLFHDYYPPDIFQIMLEMVDEVSRRLRMAKRACRTLTLGIGYSKSVGGGFSRQITWDHPVSHASIIYKWCVKLFKMYYEDEPIRRIHIHLSHLSDQSYYQYTLFEDIRVLEKEYALDCTLDTIKRDFGKNAVNRASSELESSTIKIRNDTIGGHHA